ncbi:Uncharacterized protein FWK35_00031207, partial [Aphis craccivora]
MKIAQSMVETATKLRNEEREKETETVYSYTTTDDGKHTSSANTTSAIKAKKTRLLLVQSPGFIEISSS